ncbi:M20 family peptidase [Phenylobacterium sp.]|uniref:M20 family peptidase n=1 Tax=Phenylobacterium sp. TaxID=1871053 RepID=UPI0035B1754C
MRLVGKIALAVLALVVALTVVVVVRTLTYRPQGVADSSGVRVAAPVPVDVARAAQRLSQAVQIRTVSHQDPAEDQPQEWARLHAFLEASYPAAHAAMRREVVAGRTLVYTWPGSDPALAPVVLMAHQDVVPVTPGTEGAWKHPPFAGTIADGAVWGRGAIDDKGSLITLFEGAETLAARGFRPRRTVILVAGHDEEVRGEGARAAAALLKARGLRAQFVLDEGLAVIDDHPLTGGQLAMIGTAEKGYATLKVTAPAPGGHSSAPPKDAGGVAALARAVVAIVDRPFPMTLQGPAGDMLAASAPHAPFATRMALANPWLFKPLLVRELGATPAGAALMHTTVAPTMLKGSPKENVLPQDATAWINYRIAPGDTSAEVMARARAAVGDLPVRLAWSKTPDEPSPVSSTTSDAWKTVAAVAAATTGAPVSPGLVTAGTDSRYLQPAAQDVYRFQPMTFRVDTVGMIHGTNEHLTLRNLEQAVQFYARLIATAAG